MPIVPQIWTRIFAQDNIPGLPCPYCAPGKLKLVDGTLSVVEPTMSEKFRDSPDWMPENVVGRWSARLQCDEKKCGEIVHMIGETDVAETYVEEHEVWGLEEVLEVKAVFPAPPLFRPAEVVPRAVRNELTVAFQLFWIDLAACAGRLRTAIEKMLDQQKVPRQGVNKHGEVYDMTLNDRINAFAKHAQGADAKELLHGLRNIGNMGAHGNEVTREDVFDAVDVLEDVLRGIYEKGSIKAKAQKLLGKKGTS
jgi:hypothetical protein